MTNHLVGGMLFGVFSFFQHPYIQKKSLNKKIRDRLMFEWIGGLFGLGQDGGFFIFLFIFLCFFGYIIWKFDIGDVDGP